MSVDRLTAVCLSVRVVDDAVRLSRLALTQGSGKGPCPRCGVSGQAARAAH